MSVREERYLVIVVKQTFQHVSYRLDVKTNSSHGYRDRTLTDHENKVVNFAILEVAGHHYDLGG